MCRAGNKKLQAGLPKENPGRRDGLATGHELFGYRIGYVPSTFVGDEPLYQGDRRSKTSAPSSETTTSSGTVGQMVARGATARLAPQSHRCPEQQQ